MLAEIGLILMITACILGVSVSICLFYTRLSKTKAVELTYYIKPFTIGAAIAWVGSYLILTSGFILDDFSIAYVANNSNSHLPTPYKIAAVWGSHEGSLLFWTVLLALGVLMFLRPAAKMSLFRRDATCVGTALTSAFGFCILFTANPFLRLLPGVPSEGRDLNPVLQDIGLLLHPPMLFIGYVFLCLSFIICVASLWSNTLDGTGYRLLKKTGVAAWLFLTAGNALGSWWAYNELGWGGWWFWDPVENASFIPWLLSTALIHSLFIGKKTDQIDKLSSITAITSFASCMIGTFLVRSGIVQSVHAFASDTGRGLFILAIMSIFLVPALMLFALRSYTLPSTVRNASLIMLVGTSILITAALSVLLGTLYPIFYELLGLGQLSVGAPYFNTVFVPLVFIAALTMCWSFIKHHQFKKTIIAVWIVAVSLWLLFYPGVSPLFTFMGMAAAIGLILSELSLYYKSNYKPSLAARIAHFGVAVSILGATFVSQYEAESVLRMAPNSGKTISSIFGDYSFVNRGTIDVNERAFYALESQIELYKGTDDLITTLKPQRRTFRSSGMQISQAGVQHTFIQDLYVSLGQELDVNTYLTRISIKPLVSWIWLGALIMVFAAMIILFKPASSNTREQIHD